jgi:3-oxoadipate enol-lactonase
MTSINGFQMYFEDRGATDQRDAVLFCNGSLSSAPTWHPMINLFEKTGMRVLLHDYRGQRLSEANDAPITYRQHVEDALALMDQRGIERVHLVGTSYGTVTAQLFASTAPERVLSLSLIEAFSEMDANTEMWVRSFVHWARAALDNASARAEFYVNILPLFFSPAFAKKNKALLEGRAADFAKLPDHFFKGVVRIYENQLANTPITQELHRITCPTQVIWSKFDVLTPWPLTEIILRHIPQAECVVLPSAGHVAISEKPRLLESILFGFIAQNSRQA